MNHIVIKNGSIDLLESDETLEVTLSDQLDVFDVYKIKIYVKQSTQLELEVQNKEEIKLDMEIIVESDVQLNLLKIIENTKLKVQYQYTLGTNSELNIQKFYACHLVKELDIIHLNGEGATIHYLHKTLSVEPQIYDIVVYHNAKGTNSYIINHGLNIEEGNLSFHVTSVVYEGLSGCTLDQNNRIISYNDQKCKIDPVLLIEENDVTASHSAFIGKMKEDVIFYLMSRGIREEVAQKLLVKGFLIEGFTQRAKIESLIDKHWR